MKYNPTVAIAFLTQSGLPKPELEYQFACGRKWAADFAWPALRVLLEVEGGVWNSVKGQKSRHFHGEGILNDMEKYNTAAALGWLLIRCTPKTLMTKATVDFLKHAMAYRYTLSQQNLVAQTV